MTGIRDERAGVLFDLLVEGDQTYLTIGEATGWDRHKVYAAVQRLRDVLADNEDVISVVAEPQGRGEPWVYRLAHGAQIVDAEHSQWIIGRFGDAERRLKTINHVLAAAVVALDGRSVEGRKARIYRLHLTRAEEEVAMLADAE